MILAGSPGAGKSSFIEGVKDALVLNVDDYFMRNLKDAEISLDLKNSDAQDRSDAAKAMASANKEFKDITKEIILGKKNFILDGTAASTKQTLLLKDQLDDLGYDVLMVYVFASLEKALDRNETRFERSKGKDRSSAPAIVMRTWKDVTDNLPKYAELFGFNFVAVANTLDDRMQDIDKIIDKYLKPFAPTGTKPKTPEQQKKSDERKIKDKEEIQAMLSDDFIYDVIEYTMSKEEAQMRLKQFLS